MGETIHEGIWEFNLAKYAHNKNIYMLADGIFVRMFYIYQDFLVLYIVCYLILEQCSFLLQIFLIKFWISAVFFKSVSVNEYKQLVGVIYLIWLHLTRVHRYGFTRRMIIPFLEVGIFYFIALSIYGDGYVASFGNFVFGLSLNIVFYTALVIFLKERIQGIFLKLGMTFRLNL